MADYLTPDLCVIGAGAGGLAVADLARSFGASVVLVEAGRPGGSALNTGALPVRAIGAAASSAAAIRQGVQFGIAADEGKVAFRRLRDHVEQVILAARPDATPERLSALGVELIAGQGRFVDKRTLAVGTQQIRARRFVIATGSRPVVPAIPGLEQIGYFTTDTIADNTRKLTHLVIVGGDVPAIELAQAYRRLGSEVTLVVTGAALPGIDPELARVVLERLAEEGVNLAEHSAVVAIQARSMGIGIVVQGPEGERTLDASHVLVSSGRVPYLDGLDVEKAGLKRRADHPDHLDLKSDGLTTSNGRVFALGESAGDSSVQAIRSKARLLVRNVLLGSPLKGLSAHVPRVVYAEPEIAEVGLAEAAARTRHGIGFRVLRASYAENDRARAGRDARGVAKLMVDKRGRIIGAGVAGPGAVELAGLFSLAIASRMGLRDLAGFAPPYPSFAEIAAQFGAQHEREAAARPLLRYWMAAIRLLG